MSSVELPPVDLTNCDREPIHIIGHVQPHGVLVVLNISTLKVLQVSQSVEQHFGLATSEILDQRFPEFLPAESREPFARSTQKSELEGNPTYLLSTEIAGRGPFHISGHHHNGLLMLDVEPMNESVPGLGPELQHFLKQVFSRFDQAKSVAEYCDAVVEKVQELTGFDRVMVYQFEQDGSGVVVAEHVKPGYDSFLGLHYPASDVPRQARQLFIKNQLRMYPDVAYVESPIEPALTPTTGGYLDMSHSVLRGVSRLHTEYLQNMGVRSALVLAITEGGRLWGMVNAQHHEPRNVPFDTRSACEFMTRVISLQLTEKQAQETAVKQSRTLELIQNLLDNFQAHTRLASLLFSGSGPALRLVDAAGVISLVGTDFASAGEVPSEDESRQLIEWLVNHQTEPVWSSDDLGSQFPAALGFSVGVAGILSMCLSAEMKDFVVWLRPEWIRTVDWAGNPTKPVEVDESNHKLLPRKSFELWRENVTGRSTPWSAFDTDAVTQLRDALVRIGSRWVNQASVVPQVPVAPVAPESELDPSEVSAQVGRRLGSLLDSLMRFSNIGISADAYRESDLNALVGLAVNRIQPVLTEKNAQVHITSELPTIRADEIELLEVFKSLILNGLEYNTRASKEVRIYALDPVAARQYATSPSHQPIIVCVQDNGVGMSPEYAEEVFSIFRRVKGKLDLLSGIGALPTVKKAMERQSGRVWVESIEGEGSTFFLEFAD